MTETISHRQLPSQVPFQVICLEEENELRYLRPHRHEYYEIVWLLKGYGRQNIDFVDYTMKPGQVYTLAPGQVHEGPHGFDRLLLMMFNPGFLDADYRTQLLIEKLFYPKHSMGSTIEVDNIGMQHLSHMADILQLEQDRETTDWDLQRVLLNSFLQYLVRYVDNHSQHSKHVDQRIIQLFVLIDKHFRQHKDAGFYAEQLSLTSKRMNELTRRYLGKTITRMIHDRILLEARRDLVFSVKTVKAIAHELGFDESTYFCRFFRKMTGETPLQFRQRTFN